MSPQAPRELRRLGVEVVGVLPVMRRLEELRRTVTREEMAQAREALKPKPKKAPPAKVAAAAPAPAP